ncbi:hypothetical protein DesLBE_1948 [Desulfitobacterium sp. LBE]|uniref:Uncharacterized protein n=1 Tax=Desulfitobacterium hafniense TaxID=49338 RepID=A0A098B5M8_DESHA|nr:MULTISPECIES: hypothetical protein [Desulfitobacterium]TWH57659.1 hypothetical protein DesLBE_1948 [Desulfitobacterium sp. LBE]CDX04144.1 Hypothetical protein DPCES_4258 [Desulfitobacterium hafniense]
MKRFAQIHENKAWWIFEAEEAPEFASNIVLMDITDISEVQEGWFYDPVTNMFYGEDPKPSIDVQEVLENQIVIMSAIADLCIQLASRSEEYKDG